MVQQWDAIEVDIDGRRWAPLLGAPFWVLRFWIVDVVADALAVSLGKPSKWAPGLFFGNTELSLELWIVISGISGFDD